MTKILSFEEFINEDITIPIRQKTGSPELLKWVDEKRNSLINLIKRCIDKFNTRQDAEQAKKVLFSILPPMIDKSRLDKELQRRRIDHEAQLNPTQYAKFIIADMEDDKFNFLDQRAVTPAQKEKLEKLGIQEIPANRMEASKLIDNALRQLNK